MGATLSSMIDAAFADTGPVAQALNERGRIYRKSPHQIAFAQAVGQVFTAGMGAGRDAGGAAGLFEAAAGTGKGLAYLVPMMLFCAIHNEAGLVGVASPGAAAHVARVELAMAAEVMFELTGRRLTFARRYSPQDFLSRAKLDTLIHLVEDGSLRPVLGHLRAFCDDSGLIAEWVRDNGPLPAALHPRDVALGSAFDLDSDAFAQHLAAASGADILLVPQALLVRHALSGRALGERRFACAVIDEGDALAETLDHLSAWHLSVLDLPPSAATEQLVRLARRLDPAHDGLVRLSDPRHAALRVEVRAIAARLGGLDRFVAACDRPAGPDIACLSWSPSPDAPAFEVLSRETPVLGDLRGIGGLCIAAAGETDIRRCAGAVLRGDLGGRFSPPRFGALGFNLSPPTAPKPSPEGDAPGLNGRNPAWYAWAEAVCARVAAFGQRSLVLTANAADTVELAQRLRARGVAAVIEHVPGERLSESLAAFRARPDAMLIGPELWEGIDLPGLVKHVVVTRLPIGGRDGVWMRLQAERLADRGLGPEDVQRALFARLLAQARRRVTHGIGRAIRSPRDEAQVWIADPRFPLPDSLTGNPRLGLPANAGYFRDFTGCIPERFRAGVFATWPAASLIDIIPRAECATGVRKHRSRRA